MTTTLRKQREVQRRELMLLDLARKMLVEEGYAGLKLERLAEAAEYSKGTVYQHFSTKEDLVTALATQSMEQRAALFERAARFDGRTRERMEGIGVADELFARLYPQSFRSELIIKMANLEDRASADRKGGLQLEECRAIGFPLAIAEEAVALGDLPRSTSVPQLICGIMTLAVGTQTIASNFRPLLELTRVDDPFSALRANVRLLLDGFGWKPLSTEWDFDQGRRRVAREVFPDECRALGLGEYL